MGSGWGGARIPEAREGSGREEEEGTESGGWGASLELIPETCIQIPYLLSLLHPGGGRELEDQASVRSFIHLTDIFCAPRMCDEREPSTALI